jgi:hypothetical protein
MNYELNCSKNIEILEYFKWRPFVLRFIIVTMSSWPSLEMSKHFETN